MNLILVKFFCKSNLTVVYLFNLDKHLKWKQECVIWKIRQLLKDNDFYNKENEEG